MFLNKNRDNLLCHSEGCVIPVVLNMQDFIFIIAVQDCGSWTVAYKAAFFVESGKPVLTCTWAAQCSYKSPLKTRISHYCLQPQLDSGRACPTERNRHDSPPQTNTHTKAHSFTLSCMLVCYCGRDILSGYGGSVEKVVHLRSWSQGKICLKCVGLGFQSQLCFSGIQNILTWPLLLFSVPTMWQ